MVRWKSCALLLLAALISPGTEPACPVLASAVHSSSSDNRGDYPSEGDAYESAVSELPSNISVPVGLQGTLKSMLKRSPTFRRQCKALNEAGNVRIDLRVVAPNTRLYKAISIVQHLEDGFIVIRMLLTAPSDYIEAIGHEFEHAVEQSEGLDLKSLASARGRQVYEVDKGTYETTRAIHAGHLVAQEYYARHRR